MNRSNWSKNGQLYVEMAIWPSPRLIVRNKGKSDVFMLFDHSEPDSGRQVCLKSAHKSVELNLSKELLFGINGGGGREVAPGNKSKVQFLGSFGLITCFTNKSWSFVQFHM